MNPNKYKNLVTGAEYIAVKNMIDSLEEMHDYMEKNGDDILCLELDSRVTNSDFETAEVSIKEIRNILSLLHWRKNS